MTPHTRPSIYAIKVGGRLPEHWAGWFDDMTLRYEGGNTVLVGPVADQAALYGLLDKIRDLGLPLLALQIRASP